MHLNRVKPGVTGKRTRLDVRVMLMSAIPHSNGPVAADPVATRRQPRSRATRRRSGVEGHAARDRDSRPRRPRRDGRGARAVRRARRRSTSAARSRIAYQYLRDAADADEAVQDAFVKVFTHIGSYREAWPFEVWFTRILINGCLDRRKARARRERWFAPAEEAQRGRRGASRLRRPAARSIPKRALLARERRDTAGRGDRSARRPAAHGLHAVPLRRLHAA